MRIARNIVPTAKATSTQGKLQDDGITYNQTGVTYNDSRYAYGGFYGLSDVQPTISLVASEIPRGIASRTQALLSDQGITYNQSGVSYNDLRYLYAGIYGFTDVTPLLSRVMNPIPMIVSAEDIYSAPLPPQQNAGMLMGILGLTYPS